MQDQIREMMDIEDIMYELRISKGTAYKLIRRPDFPKVQVGRKLLVRRADFFSYLDKYKKHTIIL